jgi:hypothetical protein
MTGRRWDVMSPRPKKDGGTFWCRVGTAFEGEKGINIYFDALPLPDDKGRVSVSLFEPREKTEKPAGNSYGAAKGKAPQQSYAADLDDDIPF